MKGILHEVFEGVPKGKWTELPWYFIVTVAYLRRALPEFDEHHPPKAAKLYNRYYEQIERMRREARRFSKWQS